MRVRCPAKINLDLHVGTPRADGFHPIRSWFVTVGLYDTLTLAAADDVSLVCDTPTLSSTFDNLVWRSLKALLGDRRPPRGVAIRLDKQVPVGGGLGGGSSDAAHALLALDAFWDLNTPRPAMLTMAAKLGSDVPFFLHGPSAICEGRGETVTPVPAPQCGWAVLILPDIAMPTPAVFRRFDELSGGADFDDQTKASSHDGPTDAMSLLARLKNDLEPAAFDLQPALAKLRQTAETLLGRPVRMSGSGSTLFTLYDDGSDAYEAARTCNEATGVRAFAVPIAPSEA